MCYNKYYYLLKKKKKKRKKKPILALELDVSFYKRKYTSRKWWPLIETAILCQLRLRKGSLNHSDRTWSICHNVLAHTAKQHSANHITLFSFNHTSHNELIMHLIHVLKNYMDNKRLIEFYIWSTGIGIKLIILSRMWSSIWRKPNNNFPEYFPPQFYAHVRYAIRCLMRYFIGLIYKSRFFFFFFP